MAVIALAVAGCGAGAAPSTAAGFGWLRPGPAPSDWRMLALPSGRAVLPVPPGWRIIHGDRGTVSAAVFGPGHHVAAYLNATPRQSHESLANWASFRTTHNTAEGDAAVRMLGSARGLRFRTGSGSCVEDSYRTTVSAYREIACLVHGRSASTVIIAAATPARWPGIHATLERAVASFVT